jgi:transglutaminase-like putative cysteine protease
MTELAALRRQLGWLFIWAMLPMPFLYIMQAPFWLLAGAAAALLVLRPGWVFRPSKTLLNLLAVLILASVVVAGGLNIGPLRPLGHLLLLLTAVRLLMVRERSEGLRALALVGMVWVVSVAASTHMTVALYFAASAAIFWWVGMRIHLHQAGVALDGVVGPFPRPSHLAVAVAAAIIVAVPFFIAMPRLGSPWISGTSYGRTTGFSPDVDLGKLGRITESQAVALTVTAADGGEIRERWTRFRGTAFDQVLAGSWLPRRTDLERLEQRRGVVWLEPERDSLDDAAVLDITLLRPRFYLMLPPGAVAVETDTPMARDVYGGVYFGYRRGEPLSYRVWIDEPRPPRAAPPGPRDTLLPRDEPLVRELALEVAGGLDGAAARADAVERFLRSEYDYSLTSGVGITNSDPVAWFLLEGRAGHCEFFAGSMVVMLRHLGVPARMVAGYRGGDLSPNADELVVRESNAHAWVEVWLGEGQGWVTYDPTPGIGVPGIGSVSGFERLRWAWQQAELWWDRRLLTFGLGEQVDLVDGALAGVRELVRRVRQPTGLAVVATAVVGGFGVLWLIGWWRRRVRWGLAPRRTRGPASRTVGRLARALVPVGGVVPPRATVRSIGDQAAAFWPHSAEAVGELVDRAELELYAGAPHSDPAEVRRLWQKIRRGMKRTEMTVDSS